MRIVLTLILLVAAAAGGWYLRGAWPTPPSDTADANHSALLTTTPPQSVQTIGKLEPQSGIIKIVAPQGQKIESLYSLQVGQEVVVDQPLVLLAGRELREQELKMARARKKDAQRQLAYEMDQAKLKRDAALVAIEEAKSIRDEIKIKSQSIELLEVQLEMAQQQWQRLQALKANLATRNMVGQVDLDQQSLLLNQLSSQIAQAQSEIQQATQKADRAERAAELDLRAVEQAIQDSEASVPMATLNSAIQAAHMALDQTIIKSPIKGTVLDIIVQPGDSVTNQPIMLVGDTSHIICVAEINDTLMPLVNVDDKATISSMALHTNVTGRVISKGLMIGPPSLKDPNPFGSVDRRTGRVVILLDDNHLASSFVNLQVDVSIDVSQPWPPKQ